MHHHDKLDQLLVTKVLLDHFLEVKVLAIGCSKNVLVDPINKKGTKGNEWMFGERMDDLCTNN